MSEVISHAWNLLQSFSRRVRECHCLCQSGDERAAKVCAWTPVILRRVAWGVTVD